MRNRFLVSLKLARLSVGALLDFGSGIVAHMTGNAAFAVPAVALADITTALSDLQSASNDALNGGITEVAIREEKRLIVEQLLTDEAHYVESVANDPANDGSEISIIESAGMTVRGFSPRQKAVFAVFAGLMDGTARLVAASMKRGYHDWGMTTTPEDPDSWTVLTPSTKAEVIVSGLTRGTLVSFRHRSITKSGLSDWEYTTPVIIP